MEFEALLLREVFAPFAASLGFYGDVVVGAALRSIARSERAGFSEELERLLGR